MKNTKKNGARPANARLSILSASIQIALFGASIAGSAYAQQSGAESRQETSLPEIRVTADKETATGPVDGYVAKRSATGTKTDTPIIETPASIQVIPRQVLEDQSAQNLKDVYKNVSGVAQGGDVLNAQSEVLPIIRGFESRSLMRNGLRSTLSGAVDLVNVERVEVLKGPAAMLYGAVEPGGIINYVTKRPQAQQFTTLEQQVGSFSHLRTTADVTGPMNSDGSLLYRLNVAHTDADSFRDHMKLERTAVAPSFLWKLSGQTEVLFDLSYLREKQPYDNGVPLGFNNQKLVPIETFFSDPDLKGRTVEDSFASYQLTHQLNSTWSLRNQFQMHRAHARNEGLRSRGVAGTPGNEVLRLRYQNEDRKDDETQFVLDLTGNVRAGGLNHELLLGMELTQQDSDFRRFRQNTPNVAITANPTVNFTPPANQVHEVNDTKTQWGGLYLQDQISLLDDRLKVLIGGRFDSARTEKTTDGVAAPTVSDQAFSGRGGLLYKLTDTTSAFTSVTQSFKPQEPGTLDASGKPLDPEQGTQYEAGIKGEFLDRRLLATASIYRLEKSDIPVCTDSSCTASFPGVRQRSQGIEFDVSGALTRNINIIGSYAYTDSEVLENRSAPTTVGERLGNVPLHMARLWLTYDQGGPREGWGGGAGLRYVSTNTAQFDNTKLPAYTVFDMGLWYKLKTVKLRLNIDNLSDKEYYARAHSQAMVHPGAPRTVTASASFQF